MPEDMLDAQEAAVDNKASNGFSAYTIEQLTGTIMRWTYRSIVRITHQTMLNICFYRMDRAPRPGIYKNSKMVQEKYDQGYEKHMTCGAQHHVVLPCVHP